jgi:hypothetical protein
MHAMHAPPHSKFILHTIYPFAVSTLLRHCSSSQGLLLHQQHGGHAEAGTAGNPGGCCICHRCGAGKHCRLSKKNMQGFVCGTACCEMVVTTSQARAQHQTAVSRVLADSAVLLLVAKHAAHVQNDMPLCIIDSAPHHMCGAPTTGWHGSSAVHLGPSPQAGECSSSPLSLPVRGWTEWLAACFAWQATTLVLQLVPLFMQGAAYISSNCLPAMRAHTPRLREKPCFAGHLTSRCQQCCAGRHAICVGD